MKSFYSLPCLTRIVTYVPVVCLCLMGASSTVSADSLQDVKVAFFEFEGESSSLSPEKAIDHQEALTSAANAFTMFAGRSDVDLIFKVSAALDGAEGQRLIDSRLAWFVDYLSQAPAGGMFIEHDQGLDSHQAVLSLRPATQPSNFCPWWMTVKAGQGNSAIEVTLPAGYSGVLSLTPDATVVFTPAFDPPYHLAARVSDASAVDATGRSVGAPALIRLAVAVQPIDPKMLLDIGDDDARNIALSHKVELDAPLVCTVKLIEGGFGDAVVSEQ